MIKIRVLEYYKDELFKFMPESMFEIIDEAYFNKIGITKVPELLIREFEINKLNMIRIVEKAKNSLL